MIFTNHCRIISMNLNKLIVNITAGTRPAVMFGFQLNYSVNKKEK